jgi:hypothetical protein
MTPSECLLCRLREAEVVFGYDAPDVYERATGVTAEGYARAWVRCRGCGLHYSRYSRDPAILDRIYDSIYRESTRSFRGDDAEATFRRVVALPPDASEARQRAAALHGELVRLRAQMLLSPWQKPPHRMLDVGGASGVFAFVFHEMAKNRNEAWDVEIVDPSVQGRFVEAHGVTYHARRFDDDLDTGRYHLITMCYLLEHVADPIAALRAARGRLVGSGVLYVEVPDAIAFERCPKDDDIFNACHLWMFDPSTLLRLVESAGLAPLGVTRSRSPRGHFALSVLARGE